STPDLLARAAHFRPVVVRVVWGLPQTSGTGRGAPPGRPAGVGSGLGAGGGQHRSGRLALFRRRLSSAGLRRHRLTPEGRPASGNPSNAATTADDITRGRSSTGGGPGAVGDALLELTHAADFLVAAPQDLLHPYGTQVAQVAQHVSLEGVAHLAVVAVGAAERLADDVVDDAELEQVTRRQPQRFGGQRLGLLVRLLPQDAGAPLRA